MFIAILFISFTVVYTIVNVVLVLMRNHRAHQFYKLKSPNLPVVPNASIFSGHMFSITWPGKNWRIITELHEKYGPTFGYYMCEQPWVSTKDIDLLKLIELDQPHKHINRTKFPMPIKEFNDSIFQADDDKWRQCRRAVSPALTNLKVRSDEVSSDIEHVLDQLIDGIEFRLEQARAATGERSYIMDVRDMFQRYTLAVIFLVTYKRDGQVDFRADKEEWVEQMEDAARSVTNPFVALSMMFPFIRPVCEFLVQFHSLGRLRAHIVDYIVEATDINRVAREQHQKIQRKMSLQAGDSHKERPFSELKKTGTFKRRLVDTIIDSLMENKINYEEFIGSTFFLLLAGFETTADTISCLIWHLALQPQIQEKLRRDIAADGVDSIYLSWCIQETVRWHPAVPLGTGRILGEDVTVNGLQLAKGTFIMPSTHSIHHDSSIWPEADKFLPERWQKAADFHPAAFMGFGLGPRNCVGGKLAVHEIKLVMRSMLTRYRIERCPETCDQYSFSSPGLLYTNLDCPVKVRLVGLDENGGGEQQ